MRDSLRHVYYGETLMSELRPGELPDQRGDQQPVLCFNETSGIEHLLTARKVSVILGVSVKRVYTLTIPVVKVGRRVRYRPDDVRRYIEERVQG